MLYAQVCAGMCTNVCVCVCVCERERERERKREGEKERERERERKRERESELCFEPLLNLTTSQVGTSDWCLFL